MGTDKKKQILTPDKQGFLEVDNAKVYWEYFGKGDKEAVALMNGIAMYTKSWYSFLGLLLDEYDVILYDYLGQGDSSSEDVPYDIDRFCDYLSLIADNLNIDKFHIMGISYGGMVALNYARLYPERVMSMTVSGALLTNEELYDFNRANSILLLEKAPFEVFTSILYGSIFGEKFIKNVRPMFDTMREKLYNRYKDRMHSLVRLIQTQDKYFDELEQNFEQYKSIQTPTLVMCGNEDTLVPKWVQKKIADILPNSKFEAVQVCGHVVYIEQSDIFFTNMKRLMNAKSSDFEFYTGK